MRYGNWGRLAHSPKSLEIVDMVEMQEYRKNAETFLVLIKMVISYGSVVKSILYLNIFVFDRFRRTISDANLMLI